MDPKGRKAGTREKGGEGEKTGTKKTGTNDSDRVNGQNYTRACTPRIDYTYSCARVYARFSESPTALGSKGYPPPLGKTSQ